MKTWVPCLVMVVWLSGVFYGFLASYYRGSKKMRHTKDNTQGPGVDPFCRDVELDHPS